VVVASIAWFVSTFQLVGAVLVTVVATALVKIMAVHRIAGLLGVPIWRALPWRPLAATAAAALMAALPAYLAALTSEHPFMRLALGGSVYTIVYLALLAAGWSLRARVSRLATGAAPGGVP
jgi:hypothetical protein